MTAWQPLRRLDTDPNWEVNPTLVAVKEKFGLTPNDEVWGNDEYQVAVSYLEPLDASLPKNREGMMHLSIHRKDRRPIGNWRIMQQIKNEVAGPEREAVEVYPPESRLIDTSNEYHLWVVPEGVELPFGFKIGAVTSDEHVEAYNDARERGMHKGRQEPWQEGLTTGRNPAANLLSGDDERAFYETFGYYGPFGDEVGKGGGA